MKAPADNAASMEPAVQADMHPAAQASTLPCTLACTLPSVQPAMHPDMEPVAHPVIGNNFCRKGLSFAQIQILSVLLGIGTNVTKYRELACALERFFGIRRSPDAVRGIVERLAGRGILRRKFAREGMLQGVVFEMIHTRLCPHIHPMQAGAEAPMHLGVNPAVRLPTHAAMHPDPSILEKIDRKRNLSISSQHPPDDKKRLEALSEEDTAFHWPELARSGFGTAQIRQIIQRREQLGEDTRHVMQGLTYAEWALAHNAMHDKNGAAVTSPANWVFKILATQGYYPRPPGYVSPYEQAERDQALCLKKEQEAHEARMTATYEAWAAKLTSAEKAAIIGPREGIRLPMPEGVRLRQYFRDEIWPELQGNDPP